MSDGDSAKLEEASSDEDEDASEGEDGVQCDGEDDSDEEEDEEEGGDVEEEEEEGGAPSDDCDNEVMRLNRNGAPCSSSDEMDSQTEDGQVEEDEVEDEGNGCDIEVVPSDGHSCDPTEAGFNDLDMDSGGDEAPCDSASSSASSGKRRTRRHHNRASNAAADTCNNSGGKRKRTSGQRQRSMSSGYAVHDIDNPSSESSSSSGSSDNDSGSQLMPSSAYEIQLQAAALRDYRQYIPQNGYVASMKTPSKGVSTSLTTSEVSEPCNINMYIIMFI